MSTAVKNTDLVREHVSTPPGMMFHPSLESVRTDPDIFGYAPVIERAWHEMKLNGALCMDGRPVMYLKEYGKPLPVRKRLRLHKLFWNQGVANVLVLADPVSVYIYSGLVEPREGRPDEEAEAALVETLKRAVYIRRIQTLFHALATGHFYEKETNRGYFDPEQSVDARLLENLRDFRNDLIKNDETGKGLEIRDAHAFIGRVLFLCYLLDRGIVSIGTPENNGTGTTLLAKELESRPPDSRIDYLYDLFERLKDRFNGNMFDQKLDAEKRLIRSHFDKLILFLGGHWVESGQRALFSWPYDFKMIPVETISAIYQDFLSAENPKEQRKRGAFYTPRFLAEMVVDMAIHDKPDAWNWRFLDPACGSGIFLVILFNRLARHRLARAGRVHYAKKAEVLQSVLENQIRGVDIEETACRIACFSLYLAYLDFFDPPDIEKYIEKTGTMLPRLLNNENDPEKEVNIPVINKTDFLIQGKFREREFDCVIGNPPWEGRGTKQLAQKFMEEAPRFLKNGGTGCLLLPTKILQNQTDAFQAEWLRQITLEKVLQLADYRRLLFQNAKTPAFIARFQKAIPRIARHHVEFAAPKFNRDGTRKGVVIVTPSARTWIPLADVLAGTRSKTAPVVWKRRLWGTPRDQKLLDLLQSLPALEEHVDILSELRKRKQKQTKRWIIGQGLKPWPVKKKVSTADRSPKKNKWPLDTPFVEAKPWNCDFVVLTEDTISFEERLKKKKYRTDVLYSQPSSALFHYPLVLVSRGFGNVSYSDFNVLFQHFIQSISGPIEDADFLMFLTAYLRSILAKYYLFHTSSNWGTEREYVNLVELLRVPFPLPGNDFISSDAVEIIELVARIVRKLRNDLRKTFAKLKTDADDSSLFDDNKVDSKRWRLERKKLVDSAQQEIEPLIYRYFGLTEQEITIIEDTVRVFIPSSTPAIWRTPQTVTLDPADNARVTPYDRRGLAAYADTLTGTLNTWAGQEGSGFRVQAEGGTDGETGLAMVTLVLSHEEAAFRKKEMSRNLAEILNAYYESVSKKQGTLVYERDILFFQGDRIHIVRPNILLNWTRTAALNDAARIYGEIALADEENNEW